MINLEYNDFLFIVKNFWERDLQSQSFLLFYRENCNGFSFRLRKLEKS